MRTISCWTPEGWNSLPIMLDKPLVIYLIDTDCIDLLELPYVRIVFYK